VPSTKVPTIQAAILLDEGFPGSCEWIDFLLQWERTQHPGTGESGQLAYNILCVQNILLSLHVLATEKGEPPWL